MYLFWATVKLYDGTEIHDFAYEFSHEFLSSLSVPCAT